MAYFSVLLILSLIYSGSITTATVNLCLNGNAVCGGMTAAVECTTTTTNGRLVWSINNGPSVYTILSSIDVNDNITINGSVFVFTDRASVSSGAANVYTSTASLNTLDVTSVQCSDEGLIDSLTIQPQVIYVVSYSSVSVSGNTLSVFWTPPPSAGVCCARYRVETPDGNISSTTMTSYPLNIATTEQRQNAFISVRCLDQLGTMGPEAVYRPNIINIDQLSAAPSVSVSVPEPVGDFCSGNIMFRVNLTIMEPSFGNISQLMKNCSIIAPPGVTPVNCSTKDKAAYFTSDGLKPFSVGINVTDESNVRGDNIPVSQFDPTVYLTACEIRMWRNLTWIFLSLFIILLGVSVVVVASILLYKIFYSKPKKADQKVAEPVQYEQEKDMVKM